MTDEDSIVFLGNDQIARINGWSTISIDASSITTGSISYNELYQPSYRYNYTYDYTNSFNKQMRKKTPSLKKKVLSNPLLMLTESTKSEELRE